MAPARLRFRIRRTSGYFHAEGNQMMRNMTARMAGAVAALTALAACDSLHNPGHPVLETSIGADGTTALFFYDGVGVADPALNVARFLPYPEMPVRWGLHALSRDGARALVSWNDEGRQQQADGTIAEPRDKPRIDVFATSDGRLLQSIEAAYAALALSDDGTRVVVAAPPKRVGDTLVSTLAAFDVADGAQRWSVPGAFKAIVTIPGAGAVAGIAFDLVSSATRLQIFDLDTGALRLDVPMADYAQSLAASPDGKILAIGRVEVTGADSQSANAHYLLMNVADGALVREVVLPRRSPMEGVALSSDGRFIAAVVSLDGSVPLTQLEPSGFYAHELVVWDGDALAWRRPAEHPSAAPQTIALSPDGALLVSVEYDGVALYAVATGDEVMREQFKQNLF